MNETVPAAALVAVEKSKTSVIVMASSILSILVILFGATFSYVVSRTQFEDNQLALGQRLTEIQVRLDNQIKVVQGMENQMSRIEESGKYVQQSINELKLAVVPKH